MGFEQNVLLEGKKKKEKRLLLKCFSLLEQQGEMEWIVMFVFESFLCGSLENLFCLMNILWENNFIATLLLCYLSR